MLTATSAMFEHAMMAVDRSSRRLSALAEAATLLTAYRRMQIRKPRTNGWSSVVVVEL
jgi:hypothetical protein